MPWEWYEDEKNQLYAWDKHFKKFLTKKFRCPDSWGVLFKGLGVQKDTQTPCCLRPCPQVQTANFKSWKKLEG